MKKITTKRTMYGILNHIGGFWTARTFQYPSEAEAFKKSFWGTQVDPPDMSKHQVVEVEVKLTYSPIK